LLLTCGCVLNRNLFLFLFRDIEFFQNYKIKASKLFFLSNAVSTTLDQPEAVSNCKEQNTQTMYSQYALAVLRSGSFSSRRFARGKGKW